MTSPPEAANNILVCADIGVDDDNLAVVPSRLGHEWYRVWLANGEAKNKMNPSEMTTNRESEHANETLASSLTSWFLHFDGRVVPLADPVDQVTPVRSRAMAERVVAHLHTPAHGKTRRRTGGNNGTRQAQKIKKLRSNVFYFLHPPEGE